MLRVAGKIALVTGGASRPGLGSATAERLAQEGASVIVTDIDGAGAESVAGDIRSTGGDAIALAHDVTSEADWQRVYATILDRYEGIDIVVNNAGIAVLRMLAETSREQWTRQIEVNLSSVYLGTRGAVAAMRAGGRSGSIINVSSCAGLVGIPGASAYAASKAGVLGFSKSIALETARENIRVNTVHPGVIDTNIHKETVREIPETYDMMAASIPMGFLGKPIDIANCILFLASDEARYITGTEFVVDGGYLAQ